MVKITVAKNSFKTTYSDKILNDPKQMAIIGNKTIYSKVYELFGVV